MPTPHVALDFPAGPAGPRGRTRVFREPIVVLEAASLDQVAPVLRSVDDHVRRGRHAVGFVSYEAAPAFDAALAAHRPGPLPLAWFGIFDAPDVPAADETAPGPSVAWRERAAAVSHGEAVEAIRGAIERGDVYQVNYTVRLDVDVRGDAGALYRRLVAAQGGGYGARLHTGRFEILSASPELFFRRDGDIITTQPMKGTARRGRWLDEDDQRAAALAASPKERAENVMIVDLIRNDLSRIAAPGSVQVPRLFEVHRLPTVLQMTSTIAARTRADVSTWDIFAALFPCGSVTGAPKIAASEMIAQLESDPRGVYCGAIGHVSPDGTSTFSVAIRTLTIDHHTGRAEYGVGGGITWDSGGAAEYDELRAKTAILTDELPRVDLIETLRLENGRYARLPYHLDRLEASATYFGFDSAAALRAAADRALADHARSATSTRERVRIVVAANAVVRLDASPLEPPSVNPPVVALASAPIRRNNRFLFHKTTHRAVYEQHRAQHPAAFDVLLWNEDDEITEFTIGNVVVELDGARWTPPRDCGLLAGAMRAQLLASGSIAERVDPPVRTCARDPPLADQQRPGRDRSEACAVICVGRSFRAAMHAGAEAPAYKDTLMRRIVLAGFAVVIAVAAVAAQAPLSDTDLQREVIGKLSGGQEIKPGVTLANRSTIENKQEARAYLETVLKSFGFEPKRQAYGAAGGENVYALLSSGRPSAEAVVLGAHYDSVLRAPGANDDASGVAAVMAVARAMTKVTPRARDLIIVFFDEEERGLLGSKAFAQMLADEKRTVHSVHTIDQMGWDQNHNRAIELELPYDGAVELYERVAKTSGLDIPMFTTTETGSDHSSFRRLGFPAIGITEEYRHADTTPYIHRAGDTFATIDFDYLASTTRLMIAVMKELIASR